MRLNAICEWSFLPTKHPFLFLWCIFPESRDVIRIPARSGSQIYSTSSASLTIFFQETTCVKLTENEKVSLFVVSPAHLTVESTVRFISGFPTKDEQIFFHWASWVVDPPTPAHTSTTCATCGASPGEIPKVLLGHQVGRVTLGGFHQPSGPPWEVAKKKSSHKTRQGYYLVNLENWILFLLDFHWFCFVGDFF